MNRFLSKFYKFFVSSKIYEFILGVSLSRKTVIDNLKVKYYVRCPDGIEVIKAVEVNGVKQWLHIRGRNKKNPVLLFLHGGPEAPMLGCLDAIQRTWEDYFTVVQWDQRQTGKSYSPADDENNPLTVGQYVSDTEEVIDYLLGHLGREKIFLLGFSWGSVLGMHIAKRRPECLYAYIGMGQVVDWRLSQRTSHKRLLHHACEKNDQVLKKKLLEIEGNLNDPAQYLREYGGFVQEGLSRLAGESMMHYGAFGDLDKIMFFDRLVSPHFTMNDISNFLLGDEEVILRSSSRLIHEFVEINLPEQLGHSFDVPIFFFSGTHDWQTPTVLSDQWFEQITAPHKKCLHFEESAHIIPFEEPGKLLIALVNEVLPFAHSENSRVVNNA